MVAGLSLTEAQEVIGTPYHNVAMNAHRRRCVRQEYNLARQLLMSAQLHGNPKKTKSLKLDKFVPKYYRDQEFGFYNEYVQFRDEVYPERAILDKRIANLIQQRNNKMSQINGSASLGVNLSFEAMMAASDRVEELNREIQLLREEIELLDAE